MPETQFVLDKELGRLAFPASDCVIAPFIALHGEYSPAEVAWIQSVTQSGMTCLNIGANVGYFTSWLLRLTGSSGRVIAVEANPSLIPYLVRNTRPWDGGNLKIVSGAADEKPGLARLYLNEWNCGDSRLFDPTCVSTGGTHLQHGFEATPPSIWIPAIKMDDEVSGPVDVVVVDAQGWDHHVLRGMRQLLRDHAPVVLTEFVPGWIEEFGEDPLSVLEEFESWGYCLHVPPLNETCCSRNEVLTAATSNEAWFVDIALMRCRSAVTTAD